MDKNIGDYKCINCSKPVGNYNKLCYECETEFPEEQDCFFWFNATQQDIQAEKFRFRYESENIKQ